MSPPLMIARRSEAALAGPPASVDEPEPRQTVRDATARPPVVAAVRGRRDMNAFIKLPFRLDNNESCWVPPLISERRRHLDRRRNPFFDHAEAEYFLAWCGRRVVGRISAHTDRRFNTFQDNQGGLLGFFECEHDPDAAAELFDAAAAWLRARGNDLMVGPMDFTTNHECGLLVDGFDRRPQLLENWHPYYQQLLEGYGFEQAMDLLKWQILAADHDRVRPVIYTLADRLEPVHGIRVRTMRKRDLQAEVRAFMQIYNAAWQRNWGFVPLTDREFDHYANELAPILDEKWALVAKRGDEVVAVALTLPDYNQVLANLHGRLLPFGWLRLLHKRRRIDEIRVFALGVKPGLEHTGVAAALYANIWRTVQTHGIARAETSWVLETNRAMNSPMRSLGGDAVKRYRIYQTPLG